jgi:hypothetical protein
MVIAVDDTAFNPQVQPSLFDLAENNKSMVH